MSSHVEGERALDFASASTESYGISLELVRAYQQAAWVCLELNRHTSPVGMTVVHDAEQTQLERIELSWSTPDASHRRTFADEREAVEMAATAVSLLLMKHIHGFRYFERSKITTGFDFWMGREESVILTGKTRLEVSGILNGSESDERSRSRKKVDQMAQGGVSGSGFASIVNFGPPSSRLTPVHNGTTS